MRCVACGTKSPVSARFCAECGARLALVCPRCGHEAAAGAKFCQECGSSLGGASSPASAELRSSPAPLPTRPPESYTPPHLAEKILAARPALEGERKQVTILFADVVGSTELIRGRDPEEAQAILDGVVRLMMDAVHRYEGTVSRLMGDGLMAMFGAPVAHEDHAVRACYAALAMQDAVSARAETARREYGIPVEARVGLCSGEVVVRTISDDLHMDYTAMGQTVHLAARMEQLARSGTTLLAPSTLQLVEGWVRVRSLGPLPVKGLDEPVEVFELLGSGQARTRLHAAAMRGLTRFVGRDAELVTLHQSLERAAGGHGQVAALVGEPGVGKSRLVWELTHSHRTDDWLVLESGSVSHGKATAYLPVIDLLASYCRIEVRDDPRTVREKLAGKILMLDRALEPTLPALLALLHAPVDASGSSEQAAWAALDPGQRRAATLDAVRRVLLRESREQPLLLVFEDLHWLDGETQALLDSLVESLPTARILLLVNYRPEYSHTWGSRTYYTQLRIDPLAAESAGALLDGLLGAAERDPGVGGQDSLGALKRQLLERTEGNPLFLEECVRSLVETGALAGERGAYRLTAPVAEIRVPATVQAVLAARIDRLPPEEKRLLQTAAAIGKDVPDALLRAIADRPEGEVRHGLAGLQAAEFLYEATLFPELEYTFKHALTHAVAYESLLHERRRQLHVRVVDAVERLYADRIGEHVEQLADHAFRGEDWERAVEYSRQAGQKADARAAHIEGATAYERALEALSKLPASRERQIAEVDLRLMIRTPLFESAQPERLRDHLQQAVTLADRLDDQGRLSRSLAMLAQTSHGLGRPDDAVQMAERAQEAAERSGDPATRVLANAISGLLKDLRGDFPGAVKDWTAILHELKDHAPESRFGLAIPMRINALNQLAEAYAEIGDFSAAFKAGREAIQMAEHDGRPLSLASSHRHVGYALLIQGDLANCEPHLWRSLEAAQAGSLYDNARRCEIFRAQALYLADRPDEALAVLDPIVKAASLTRPRGRIADALTWYGAALGRSGRWHEAQEALAAATRLAVVRGERGHEAYARWLTAKQAGELHPDTEAQEAEALHRAALTLAEELKMRPLQAHCHLGLGKLYRRVGRSDEAHAELTAAVSMLREMGMTFWLPDAEAELDR